MGTRCDGGWSTSLKPNTVSLRNVPRPSIGNKSTARDCARRPFGSLPYGQSIMSFYNGASKSGAYLR